MKFETAELKCMDCGKKFCSPRLGDFAYGSFVFSGEKGGVFGYFHALENPAWDFMTTVFTKNGSGRQADCDYGERLQAACAYFADAIKGQKLRNHSVCPHCYSANVEEVGSRNEVVEVPEVSHVEFLSMPGSVRRQKILEFDRVYGFPK
jgi:Zn finger protein HypA/HybF involved in hydrogenase expression